MSLRQFGAAGGTERFALDWTELGNRELRRASDGWHGVVALAGATHRLYLPTIPAKGAPLSLELPLDATLDIRLEAAHRFWCAIDGRRLGPSPLALPPQRRRRFVLMLRALDAWLSGHSYREVAEGLFGKARVDRRPWKDSDLRSHIIRLIKSGVALMRGGYRALLRPSSRKK